VSYTLLLAALREIAGRDPGHVEPFGIVRGESSYEDCYTCEQIVEIARVAIAKAEGNVPTEGALTALTLQVQWDERYWLCTDNVWAYGTGKTPEAAIRSCRTRAREFVQDVQEIMARGEAIGNPALRQYEQYSSWFAQGEKAGMRASTVTPKSSGIDSRVYKCNNCKEQTQRTDAGACLVCGWNESLRCVENSHGNTHCWHWKGQPPTPQTEVQAACCWCGAVRAFGYDAVLDGRAPRSPSPGAIHGIATELPKREVREQYRIAAKEPLIVGVTTLENPGVGLPPGFGEAITYHTTRLTQARDVDRGTAAPAQPGEAVQGT